MEYKELIKELRFLSKHVPEDMCDENGKDALEQAADVIEAAIKDLENTGCETCKYEYTSVYCYPCCDCKRVFGLSKTIDKWEWRGIASTDKNKNKGEM